MDIDIGEEWIGNANGPNLFINNRVMVLDYIKMWGGVDWECKWAKFVYKQQSYGP